MRLKKLHLLILATGLAFGGTAKAQLYATGTAAVYQSFTSADSTWDSSSFTLNAADVLVNPMGVFALEPNFSGVTADDATITGLSSTPTTENINDFFVFSTTSPRLDFNLATLTEIAPGAYYGTGTLVDTMGATDPTAAEFHLSFSSPEGAPLNEGNYSFTIAALGVAPVPEPGTMSLIATGLLGALAWRRRKV
jgi:hypothetical protein